MKRVGKRGEGKFERISWDEAIDLAATKLKEVIEKYGNEAVYLPYATGVSATTARPFNRLLNMLGGSLNRYGEDVYKRQPLGSVDLPAVLEARPGRAPQLAGELVPEVPDRARQRAGHRGRVLALP